MVNEDFAILDENKKGILLYPRELFFNTGGVGYQSTANVVYLTFYGPTARFFTDFLEGKEREREFLAGIPENGTIKYRAYRHENGNVTFQDNRNGQSGKVEYTSAEVSIVSEKIKELNWEALGDEAQFQSLRNR